MPCCDYRDHRDVCLCDNHPSSSLHPYGRLPETTDDSYFTDSAEEDRREFERRLP